MYTNHIALGDPDYGFYPLYSGSASTTPEVTHLMPQGAPGAGHRDCGVQAGAGLEGDSRAQLGAGHGGPGAAEWLSQCPFCTGGALGEPSASPGSLEPQGGNEVVSVPTCIVQLFHERF